MAPSDAIKQIILDIANQDNADGMRLIGILGSCLDPAEPVATAPATLFAALTLLDGEVGNGGFFQYFTNSSGDGWLAARAALELIGDRAGHDILLEAVARFPGGPAKNRDDRRKQLTDMGKPAFAAMAQSMDAFDRRWWDHNRDLGAAFVAWIRKNGPGLRFRSRPENASTFELHIFRPEGAANGWGDRFGDSLKSLEVPRCSGGSNRPGGDDSISRERTSILRASSDKLHVIILGAKDPALARTQQTFSPLAAGFHLLGVIVGSAMDLPDWCMTIPTMGSKTKESVVDAIRKRLVKLT